MRRGITAVVLLGLLGHGLAAASEAYSSAYGPKATMRYSRPTLRWEVWPGPGGKVTDSMMSLNGRRVAANYDTYRRQLAYTPETPLSPGSYKVSCKVVVDNALPVTRDWQFTVTTNAVSFLPDPDDVQQRALVATNEIRDRLGLEPFSLDKRLCAASFAHSSYLAKNNLTGHYETVNTPGFLGKTPEERLEAFGFVQSSWECVNYGGRDLRDAVQSLFDAPYHRIPFMQPGSLMIGAGYTESRLTMEFEMASREGVVVSPCKGQTDVPLSWDALERPDPFRIHGDVPRPCGYPIVYSFFSPQMKKIRVLNASLKTFSGDEVPVWINKPENDDELEFSVILIPRKPLTPGTAYMAKVQAVTEDGKDITDVWEFSTVRS